jgi:uncharacterized membrane protein
MWKSIQFAKTTVVGGFFIVLPIALAAIILSYVVDIVADTIEPLLEGVPVDEIGGVGIAILTAILLILLLCFAAGVLIRTQLGTRLHEWLEQTILNRIPGFSLVKNLTSRFSPQEGSSLALARLHPGGAQVIAFVAEDIDEERVAIFVPLAPTPTVGTVYVVERANVERLETGTPAALNCLMPWGLGAREILTRRQ